MTDDIPDDAMDMLVTSYAVLASVGIRCVTKDGEDLTDKIKKAGNIKND